ncbi:alpha/beta hydrolase [Streptomyces sp. NPDC046887]|uniref:alpha/beta fold hydrolase n=1 Tax=Streptomyces sp. NPDC046887 TaxID=3155472 RepID=UPI0033C88032
MTAAPPALATVPASADTPFTADDRFIAWRGRDFPCRVLHPLDTPASVPLLVLGGGLQDRRSWARLERRLGHRHPLVIPDLPPARTPRRAGDHSGGDHLGWDDLTDAALHAADQTGPGHFAVLGVSSGYPVAYRLAQRHPERLTHLLLFGAAPRPGPRLRTLIHEGLAREAAPGPGPHREAAGRLVDLLTNPRAGADRLMIRAAARMLRNQLTASPRDPLARYVADRGHLLLNDPLPAGGVTGVRALVGVGAHDSVTTVEDNRAVAATIEHATLAVMRDADHLLHMERDADFADLIGRFLHRRPLTTPGTLVTRP